MRNRLDLELTGIDVAMKALRHRPKVGNERTGGCTNSEAKVAGQTGADILSRLFIEILT